MSKLKHWLAGLLVCALVSTLAVTPSGAVSLKFRDVPAGYWAASDIAQAVEAGLVQGETADTFGLGHPMTRAAFTVILCRLFGWETVRPAEGTFTDVQDTGAWYYSAVETACANGAVTLQSDRFRPNDPITREEMAVMLIRALGYTSMAGLDQGLSCPFTDVDSNKGYLTMAYYLGISGGTGAATFSPDQTATREQAVAMLMRVYRCCTGRSPERIGVAGSFEMANIDGCDVVVLSSARLLSNGSLAPMTADANELAKFRTRLAEAGAKTVLRISGSKDLLRSQSALNDGAKAAAKAAADYDGILLDIEDLGSSYKAGYTSLTQKIRSLMGDGKLLYVTADAPAVDTADNGYDYKALAAAADRLILRVDAYKKTVNGFPTGPQEPLEEIYYGLASLKGRIDLSKCSLWLSTTGLSWTGGKFTGSILADQIQEMLLSPSTDIYYSRRYAEAYLTQMMPGANKNTRTVVWFHDEQAVAARVRLCAFFGVDSVCLSNLSSVADYGNYSVLRGLKR